MGEGEGSVRSFIFTKNPNLQKVEVCVCVWGGGARVCDFFKKESKSKKMWVGVRGV